MFAKFIFTINLKQTEDENDGPTPAFCFEDRGSVFHLSSVKKTALNFPVNNILGIDRH